MRVLYVVTRAGAAGAQVHICSLIQGLPKACELAVAVGEEGYITEAFRRKGGSVFIVPGLARSIRPDLTLRAILGIKKIIADWCPDLVHAHCLNGGFAGRLAARWAGCPSVYTVHGWQFAKGTPALRRPAAFLVEWLGARLGNAIITVCDYDRRDAVAWMMVNESRLYMIYNGVVDRSTQSQPARRPIEVNLVMVARFMPQKDQVSLIRACEQLPGAWKLRFVGDGPTMDRAHAEVERLGLRDRIEFMGHRADVTGILESSDIFVLASHYEGLPISILEAMRAGLPVVATGIGGVSECVHNGSNGLVVPPGDPGALRDALATLIQSPQLRSAMGAAGRQLYEDAFTVRPMVEKTAKVYETVSLRAGARSQK
ncbi:MAG: glycosyltransferase family 4 protein [Terracidiphilus sp.]|jgi:glycosyltransferase involved in cell wall biosynthesis